MFALYLKNFITKCNDILLVGVWCSIIGFSVRYAVSSLIRRSGFDYVLRACFSFVTSSVYSIHFLIVM